MKLYHGSNVSVNEPSLEFSNKSRDFGRGFYLTSDLEQASIWSIKKTEKLDYGSPIVSIFEFDEINIMDLNIKKFDKANLEWFDYVIKNRKKDYYFDEYDVVIGPVANDGTYEVINLCMRGIITQEQAIDRLESYKLKDQFAFKTDKALNKLIYKGVV